MIRWYEGEILSYDEPTDKDDPVLRITVRELTQNISISDVQMHIKDTFQERPPVGSTIAFYRDTAATAKYGFLLRDPRPIASPIANETAVLGALSGTLLFESGEVALKARGTESFPIDTPGANLWLRNSGDGFLISGSFTQRVSVSDSTDSVDIEGTNVDIYSHGNLLATHAIHIDCDTLGITSMSIGLKNPTTGIFASRIKSDIFGAFSIGLADPVTDSLLSGFSYSPVPILPSTILVPECKMVSIPLTSEVKTNPAGTSVTGPIINLISTDTNVSAAAAVNVTSPLTTVEGAVVMNGISTVTGSFIVAGDTTLVADDPLLPLINATAGIGGLLSYVGPTTPGSPGPQTTAGITLKIPVTINGVPVFLLAGI